jgi:hypothetical protein
MAHHGEEQGEIDAPPETRRDMAHGVEHELFGIDQEPV